MISNKIIIKLKMGRKYKLTTEQYESCRNLKRMQPTTRIYPTNANCINNLGIELLGIFVAYLD